MALLPYGGNTSVSISYVEENRNFGNTPNTVWFIRNQFKNIQFNNKYYNIHNILSSTFTGKPLLRHGTEGKFNAACVIID